MLPLDSPRWIELDTFFGNPERVPVVLAEWVDAVGFDEATTIYQRDLFNLFLHQGTITNVAYAVVPWLVAHCTRAEDATDRACYVCDVALVEFNRLTHGIYYVREGGDREPEWLMTDYRQAVEAARPMAEDLLDEPLDESLRQNLWELTPALWGNAELARKRMSGGP